MSDTNLPFSFSKGGEKILVTSPHVTRMLASRTHRKKKKFLRLQHSTTKNLSYEDNAKPFHPFLLARYIPHAE